MNVAESDKVGTIDNGGDCENETVKRSPSKNLNGATGYLISEARLMFTRLKKAFTKAPILRHFDLEYHIWIQNDALG